jgi:hypothetical protein
MGGIEPAEANSIPCISQAGDKGVTASVVTTSEEVVGEGVIIAVRGGPTNMAM